ncbi:hypothetical protein [Streptomyces sp. NBC_01716]|uniref:hypothetical protein n=1 Tax=Streptomyces sp. NBC_01716 TaxID=2975917 RepID=UPI002E32B2FC|nr:hypothetical protein [Streptomyces sp. NBC_01716]
MTVNSAWQGENGALAGSATRRASLDAHDIPAQCPEHSLTAALELRGTLDEPGIQVELRRVVARHSALRGPEAELAVPLDRRWTEGETADDRRRGAFASARREAHQPFPSGPVPRIRAVVFSFDTDRHLLLVVMDPRVCDAWSANLVVEELLDGERHRPASDHARARASRLEWLTSSEGRAAVAQRESEVRGALRFWPGARPSPSTATAPGPAEEVLDLDDALAKTLKDKIRHIRGSLLAVTAQALALSAGATSDPRTPLALTTTLAARRPDEEGVVGRFSTDGVLVVPPRTGTVKDHLSALRREVFTILTEQRVPYDQLEGALQGPLADDGLSFSLLFLPNQLSGGEQNERTLAGLEATRVGVSICPTGADVDLFVVEHPPPLENGHRPLLRIGAMSSRTSVTRGDLDRILTNWMTTLRTLADTDWATTRLDRVLEDLPTD